MSRRQHPAPDGDNRGTGSSDAYLADVVRQRRTLVPHAASPHGDAGAEWNGEERRTDDVTCFDPYLVELARRGR